jgi:hypothetical protein
VTTLGRLTPAGNPDPSFRPNSSTATAAGVGSGGVFAVDRSGRILIEGIRESARYRRPKKNVDLVFRLHPNGSLDTRFGRNGTAGVRLASNTYFSGIAADSHGRVLRAGGRGTSACAHCATKPGKGHVSFALLRLRANGKLDRRFGRGGRVLTSFGSKTEAFASDVMIDHRGRILVGGLLFKKSPFSSAGSFTSVVSFALARYTG